MSGAGRLVLYDRGGDPQIGFRCRTTVDDSPAALRQTQLAVARAREGDEAAFRFLYLRFSNNIYGYVRSIVRDDHEAEDVTQQVFAKLMTSLVKYNDRGTPFFGWLLRLARTPPTEVSTIAACRSWRLEARDPFMPAPSENCCKAQR